MLGSPSTRTVICICLFVAICTLFLRTIVYHGDDNPDVSTTEKNQPQGSPLIILAYHIRPPYYVTGRDHYLTGLVGKPAVATFRRSGLSFVTQQMPPKAQLNRIQGNKERICAVGWFKTPERELFARFTLPIYQDPPTSVLARADIELSGTAPTLHELLTTSTLTLLMKSGYSYGPSIDQALQAASPVTTTTTGSTAQMLEMIATGKADYLFISAEEAGAVIAASPDPAKFRLITLSDMVPGDMRYLMCSQQVTTEEIARLNQAIAADSATEGTVVRSQ